MYNILLADDELPALRFLETIIQKYAPGFAVTEKLRNGADALKYLEEHLQSIDVLITDIKMPDMDGISLAKAARSLRSDLHIVIVSGYQEFEYAHGAITASVDDYLLKPVSVSHMKELLERIREQLDRTKGIRFAEELTALLTGQPFSEDFLRGYFGENDHYYALLRFGNVTYPQNPLVHVNLTTDYPGFQEPDEASEPGSRDIYVLNGRDSREFLLVAPASQPVSVFRKNVQAIAENSGFKTVTLVFSQGRVPLQELRHFYTNASRMIRRTAVVGHYREILLSCSSSEEGQVSAPPSADGSAPANISGSILRQLERSVSENNRRYIRNTFLALGTEWDKTQVTQRQAYIMMMQLLHLIEALRREHWKDTDQIMLEAEQLTNVIESYREMNDRLFTILFEGDHTENSQMTPEDMYHYAVKCIEEKFNQSINIQSVCSEIGISPTYLSRLFRKFGDTSFNASLIQCRMKNARKILETRPDVPLHEVAACVGYEDYAYFSKVFRQVTGCSPSQYQAKLSK